jgi:S1-C subfamily serine protease/mono/diheme cytochrome c family protein
LRPAVAVSVALLGACILPGDVARPQAPATAGRRDRDRPDPAQLVFLLQYIGVDYGLAVRDRRVANAFEYQEMLDFSELLVEQYGALRGPGASTEIASGLQRLRQAIRELRPWDEVLALSRDLASRLSVELDVVRAPPSSPDLSRGRELYATDCAACHGPRGGGDGRAASGMEPAPSSFRDPARVNLLSPHQVASAIEFGIDGTAMPSYRGAYSADELWAIAFFVMTLRQGFDPRPPAQPLPLTLEDLARHSNQELLERWPAQHAATTLAYVDHYRLTPPGPPAAPEADAGLKIALELERLFAGVAERVFPAVAGVSLYRKDEGSGSTAEAGPSWQQAQREEQLYPGYRRVRSGTGFFVTEDGFLLSCEHLLSEADNAIIDVELPQNLHFRARVIGVEPTIDLAVLKVEAPIPMRAAAVGDSDAVRVGQWAIALGDPPGAGKTFVPGTIAARPERDCYQENRTSTLVQSSIRVDAESYGGPLVDIHGKVIGVSVPGAGTVVAGAGGPVYALPINLAINIYEALKVRESRRSPWLGIAVRDLTWKLREQLRSSPRTGLYIEDIFDPSPASRAGIRVGDILTAMDGHRVLAVADFQRWLYLSGIGNTVALEIFRDGAVLEKRVVIEQRPESAPTR